MRRARLSRCCPRSFCARHTPWTAALTPRSPQPSLEATEGFPRLRRVPRCPACEASGARPTQLLNQPALPEATHGIRATVRGRAWA
eukprot:scaffold260197_cov31-Tisochrysis_lutea.AAC.2